TALTVTDGAISADSSKFIVDPGPLASFDWTTEPGASQVAGAAFTAAATAYDAYGNVKTNYSGATFTGLHNAPNGSQTATYPTGWVNGVSTGDFTGYRTEPGPGGTKLKVQDGTISAQSTSFVVTPADPGSVTYTQQPLESQ